MDKMGTFKNIKIIIATRPKKRVKMKIKQYNIIKSKNRRWIRVRKIIKRIRIRNMI